MIGMNVAGVGEVSFQCECAFVSSLEVGGGTRVRGTGRKEQEKTGGCGGADGSCPPTETSEMRHRGDSSKALRTGRKNPPDNARLPRHARNDSLRGGNMSTPIVTLRHTLATVAY